ncbi:MAG: Fic family protein [Bacteroides sp.]|nr:Fic family protein [Bacteroides sp.]MCM1085618.1 Fic family protein [Bacteroides sp.]
MFIHENPDWTAFRWDSQAINALEMQAMHRLGYLAGRMAAIGFDTRLVATVEAITNDVVASSEIEGVRLDTAAVRSSVARRFGVSVPQEVLSGHYIEGVVDMMLDATRHHQESLTEERLLAWHGTLFPNKTQLTVGAYRSDEMSVVSGMFGREKVHYRAPAPERVPREMAAFLQWFNEPANKAGILKSAIAHFWFVSIHPFDDGNGRIGRAISDMVLAALDGDGMHFYSLSRQILKDKNHYYRILEQTQRGDGDLTAWIAWYIGAMTAAVADSDAMLSMVLRKARFWNTHAQANITERQRRVLNKYLDGYDAKLTAKNWEKIAGVSKDTALRDIAALAGQGILVPTPGRVRDIAYSLNYTSATAGIDSLISDIRMMKVGADSYISGIYKGDTELRDKVLLSDIKRLEAGEVTLQDLAYKYFAYLLE